MSIHKHARLTFARRLEMVQALTAKRCRTGQAARTYGVTPATVRKWLGRFLAQGAAGLADTSSRPSVSPRVIAPAKALAIVELRRKRLTQARIAQALGVCRPAPSAGCWHEPGSHAWPTWSPPNRSCATSSPCAGRTLISRFCLAAKHWVKGRPP